MYTVIEGTGATEIAGQRFEWEKNDIFVVPNFLWRRHFNTGPGDAVLYSVSDAPLMEKVGPIPRPGTPCRRQRGEPGGVGLLSFFPSTAERCRS